MPVPRRRAPMILLTCTGIWFGVVALYWLSRRITWAAKGKKTQLLTSLGMETP